MTPAEILSEEGRIEALREMAQWLGAKLGKARTRIESARTGSSSPSQEG